MANIDRYINKKKRSEEGNQVEFERKIIRDGSNKFRIVGEIKFVFEHWFKSKDGNLQKLRFIKNQPKVG